jgi:predicted house-cleaning noncanonical NTP pyrophosphatase (MazG superfamily)
MYQFTTASCNKGLIRNNNKSFVVKPPLDQALLRDYIEYARENVHPEISDEALEQLIASYLEMHNSAVAAYGSNGTRTILPRLGNLNLSFACRKALPRCGTARLSLAPTLSKPCV